MIYYTTINTFGVGCFLIHIRLEGIFLIFFLCLVGERNRKEKKSVLIEKEEENS